MRAICGVKLMFAKKVMDLMMVYLIESIVGGKLAKVNSMCCVNVACVREGG